MDSLISTGEKVITFRIGQSDFFTPPQTKVSPLELLRHQGIKLLSWPKTSANLEGKQNVENIP